MATRSGILKVPGARLYYEVQGSGPMLLIFPGGPTDAGIFAGLAGFLANRFTVASYDPRGPPEYQQMDVHGDDAAQLLAALCDEPAFVLGSSGGAQIGLNLAARCGDQEDGGRERSMPTAGNDPWHRTGDGDRSHRGNWQRSGLSRIWCKLCQSG
jgi:pimeloyl-ACP methyl ester carboxylesterase